MAQDAGILFADISGSTRLYRTLGTEEAKRQLERSIKRMERSIESCKGRLIAPSGDEIVAVFPSADDVIAAALDMQRRIADLPPVSGVRLTIRIGAHYGSVEETPDQGIAGGAVEVGRALLNLAGAGQIVTCEQTAASMSPALKEALIPLAGMVLATELGDIQVLEVKEPEGMASYSPASKSTVTSGAQPPRYPERLIVRAGGVAYVVDTAAPRLTFGRDRASGYILSGLKASRQHAVIEKRGRGGFVLRDQSTNGTYLKIEGGAETHLQNGESVITGRGKIAFGHSTGSEGDVVDFEIV